MSAAPTDPATAAAKAQAIAVAKAEIDRIGAISAKYLAAVAGVTVWDWLVQLRAEYIHIWLAEFSLIKCAYIFCRYWNMGVVILALVAFNSTFSQSQCDHIVRIQAAVSVVTVCSGAFLLLLRTCAVWLQARWILILLGFLLVSEFIVMLSVGMVNAQAVPILDASGRGHCYPASKGRSIIVYWVMPVIFDTTATILMSIKAYDTFKLGSPLARILLRDGLWYFFSIAALNFINIGFWAQSNPSIQGVNAALALSFSSVLACRMALSIKDQGQNPTSSESSGLAMSNKLGRSGSTGPPAYLSFNSKQSADLHIRNEKPVNPSQTVESLSYVAV